MQKMQSMKVVLFLFFLSVFFLSCHQKDEKSNITKDQKSTASVQNLKAGSNKEASETQKNSPKSQYINTNDKETPPHKVVKNIKNYTGDLEELKKRKVLRILAIKTLENPRLPKQVSLLKEEYKFLRAFAKQQNMRASFVYKQKFSELIPALIRGEGDVIAANFTILEKRKEKINFTNALTSIDEVLVSKKGEKITDLKDIKERKLYIKKSSSYFETILENQLNYVLIPETMDEEHILDHVADGKYDLTLFDDNKLDEALLYRDDIQKNIAVKKHLSIAWGIRKDGVALKKALDAFIHKEHIDLRIPRLYTVDWQEIKKRGYIRILTRNNSLTYFLYKGRVFGFEYELVKLFAKKHRLRVEFVIPPSRDLLLPWLLKGRGDIIAASTTTHAISNKGIAYTSKYMDILELVVGNPKLNITTEKDLKGRVFHVRKESSYYKTLLKYQKEYGYEIQFVKEDKETEEILEDIEDGVYDLTLADSSIVNREMAMGTKIKAFFSMNGQKTYSWITRASNPQLLQEVNQFFKKNYKGLEFNMIYNKYFKNIRRILKHDQFDASKTKTISVFDRLFKKYGKKYGFHWLMVASQSYQESRFNPRAKSWVGAIGLMQVMPKTGKMLGFTDLYNPNISVHAGVKYMNWIQSRFDEDIPAKDKLWFSLASYNAGYGHVLDAMRVAKVMGLNPNKWFKNVEFAMTKLSKKKYRKYTKYGYCKCKEPIAYVSQIKTRYEAYKGFIEEE